MSCRFPLQCPTNVQKNPHENKMLMQIFLFLCQSFSFFYCLQLFMWSHPEEMDEEDWLGWMAVYYIKAVERKNCIWVQNFRSTVVFPCRWATHIVPRYILTRHAPLNGFDTHIWSPTTLAEDMTWSRISVYTSPARLVCGLPCIVHLPVHKERWGMDEEVWLGWMAVY